MCLKYPQRGKPGYRVCSRTARSVRLLWWALFAAAGCPGVLAVGTDNSPGGEQAEAPPPQSFYIREYRVVGARQLPRDEVDFAVYPYLGPGRTAEEVELARAALEQRYHRAGFQTVVVELPVQDPTRGVVVLVVKEMPVGRLTTRGSRFHDIERIKRKARSLREGSVPNFRDVEKEVITLNRSRDLRVMPEFKPGASPGTVDVELVVEDSFPLHASAELNNRYSENTTPLRLDLSARYENLWQAGHTIGLAMQVAPENVDDALIYSGYYMLPVPRTDNVSLLFQAIRQNSNVSTLGGTASAGNGEIYGSRLIFELPPKPGLFHSLTFGVDYKNFEQSLTLNNQLIDSSPVTYWPFLASYSGFWMGKNYRVSFDGSINWHFRGMGSGEVEFDNRRYAANGNYFYFRGLTSYEQDLWHDFRFKGTVQGQATANALVDGEQFALGGLNTVRGYLESQVVGDSAVAGSIEVQSPSLLRWLKSDRHELRLLAFLDAGAAYINDPLPEQLTQFNLWSVGFGAEAKILGWLTGSFVVGIPQISQGTSEAGEPLFVFRLSGEL